MGEEVREEVGSEVYERATGMELRKSELEVSYMYHTGTCCFYTGACLCKLDGWIHWNPCSTISLTYARNG